MYRGIRCSIPNEHGQILGALLAPIDLTQYVWKLGNSEAYLVREKNHFVDFFSEADYEQGIQGVDLQRKFETNMYYTIFVDLQGYPSEPFSTITTYEDFVNSHCEVLILFVDCTYLDIYCKDQPLLDNLYQHAKTMAVTDLHYLSEDNDGRSRMSTS